jgi:hypothetical protein
MHSVPGKPISDRGSFGFAEGYRLSRMFGGCYAAGVRRALILASALSLASCGKAIGNDAHLHAYHPGAPDPSPAVPSDLYLSYFEVVRDRVAAPIRSTAERVIPNGDFPFCVDLAIDLNGDLVEVRMRESSGLETLDHEIVALLEGLSPYRKPPVQLANVRGHVYLDRMGFRVARIGDLGVVLMVPLLKPEPLCSTDPTPSADPEQRYRASVLKSLLHLVRVAGERTLPPEERAYQACVDLRITPEGKLASVAFRRLSGLAEFDAELSKFLPIAATLEAPPRELMRQDGLAHLEQIALEAHRVRLGDKIAVVSSGNAHANCR